MKKGSKKEKPTCLYINVKPELKRKILSEAEQIGILPSQYLKMIVELAMQKKTVKFEVTEIAI